ncbi:MAG: hypothetical protein DME99_05295 [Verrucomicrobia bacterium]|nr:MAG: hypothetical protein DME99_05295 [Verrucomicrobiota bacterium]
MYRKRRASSDGFGCSKGQTRQQVSKGEERAQRAYGLSKRWKPRRADENSAKFSYCEVSACHRGVTTREV